MPSIYITSKKRLDSRILWLIGILIVGLAMGLMYYWFSPILSNKSVENTPIKSQPAVQSEPSSANLASIMAPSEPKSISDIIDPVTPNSPPETKNTDTAQSQNIPNNNPMDSVSNSSTSKENLKVIEGMTSSQSSATKPTLTMEEVLNQTKP